MKSRIFVNNQQNNGNHKWSCLKGSSIWLDFFHCCYSHMNSIERKPYEQHEDSSSFQFSFGSSSMNSVCLWRIALFPFAWFDIWFYQSTTYHSRNGWAYNTLLLLLHTIGIGRKNLWSILQCCCLIGVESLLPTLITNKQAIYLMFFFLTVMISLVRLYWTVTISPLISLMIQS